MSVDLGKLVSKRQMGLEELNGRIVAIDAYNVLYQFLSIIRQQDGSPLTDSKGNITSHLSGLFYRTIDMIGYGAMPIYVFDGLPSPLKQKALEARIRRREDARESWRRAKEEGDTEKMRLFAQSSTSVNRAMVQSAKELLDCMGVYHINAASEGEAQASVMCRKGIVDLVISQDYDTLLLGAPKVARNVTVSGKRKLPSRNIYVEIKPELVDLNDTLDALRINQKQLVWIGILLGTDFNDGIKGVGPKTALKIVKNAKSIDDVVKAVKGREEDFEVDVKEVIELFEKPEVAEIGKGDVEAGLKLKPNKEKILKFMCDEHEFSHDRIGKHADKLVSIRGAANQQNLGGYFR